MKRCYAYFRVHSSAKTLLASPGKHRYGIIASQTSLRVHAHIQAQLKGAETLLDLSSIEQASSARPISTRRTTRLMVTCPCLPCSYFLPLECMPLSPLFSYLCMHIFLESPKPVLNIHLPTLVTPIERFTSITLDCQCAGACPATHTLTLPLEKHHFGLLQPR